jgi:hypothetical protein
VKLIPVPQRGVAVRALDATVYLAVSLMPEHGILCFDLKSEATKVQEKKYQRDHRD